MLWLLDRVQSVHLLEDFALEVPFEDECLQLVKGGLKVVGGYFQSFPREMALFPSDLIGDLQYSLVAGSLDVQQLVWWRFFWGLDSQNYRFSRVSEILGGTASLL